MINSPSYCVFGNVTMFPNYWIIVSEYSKLAEIIFITLKNCFLVSVTTNKGSVIGLVIMIYDQCTFLYVSI